MRKVATLTITGASFHQPKRGIFLAGMCGRMVRTSALEALREEFRPDVITAVNLTPRYNLCPGDQMIAIVQAHAKQRMGTMRWGFHPTSATERPPPAPSRSLVPIKRAHR